MRSLSAQKSRPSTGGHSGGQGCLENLWALGSVQIPNGALSRLVLNIEKSKYKACSILYSSKMRFFHTLTVPIGLLSLVAAAPTLTTTTTSAACSPTSSPSTGFITNGDFETGVLSPWSTSVSQGAVSARVLTSGQAFSNCDALSLLPTSAPSSGNRQIFISQSVTGLTQGSTYTFTLYQGRLSSAATLSNPTIAATAGSTRLLQVTACGGSGSACTLAGSGGTVWTKIAVKFTAPAPGFTVTIGVTWLDPNDAAETILLDDISIA